MRLPLAVLVRLATKIIYRIQLASALCLLCLDLQPLVIRAPFTCMLWLAAEHDADAKRTVVTGGGGGRRPGP